MLNKARAKNIVLACHPVAFGIAAALVQRFVFSEAFPENPGDLFSNVINVCSISIGFMAGGLGLLYALPDNYVMQQIRKAKTMERQLIRFFKSAIAWAILLSLVSLVGYWVDMKDCPSLFSVWLGLAVTSFFSNVRVARLMFTILEPAN